MSWLYDKKPQKFGGIDGKRDPDDWGYMCGYCKNTFQGDLEQYNEHMKSAKHTMCKGVNDKLDKELARSRGLYVGKIGDRNEKQ